jgi:hypothetical protein
MTDETQGTLEQSAHLETFDFRRRSPKKANWVQSAPYANDPNLNS